MKDFSIAVAIAAPPGRVADVLFDIERWPEWTSTVTSVQRLDDGPFALGCRARVRQPKLWPAVWQVTGLEANRSFDWVMRSRGLQVKARHLVEADGPGSRVTLSLRFSGPLGPLMARILRDLNQRYLTIEAEGLKNRCEGSKIYAPAEKTQVRG